MSHGFFRGVEAAPNLERDGILIFDSLARLGGAEGDDGVLCLVREALIFVEVDIFFCRHGSCVLQV
jgi:hypothetical protein